MEMAGPTDDDERVARAVAGDLDELEQLLREVTPAVLASLEIDSIWSRSFDRDDVLQVSFLEAYLRIRTLRTATMGGFRAWLARIATNNLRDAVRALERDKRPSARRRVTQGPEGQSARTLLAAMTTEDPTARIKDKYRGNLERNQKIKRNKSQRIKLPHPCMLPASTYRSKLSPISTLRT